MHVAVKNYAEVQAAGVEIREPAMGIDRAWQVYADSPVQSEVTLQHNVATSGSRFTPEEALITRYVGISPNTAGGATSSSKWDFTTQPAAGTSPATLTSSGSVGSAAELSRTFTALATSAANGWLTKARYQPSVLAAFTDMMMSFMLVPSQVVGVSRTLAARINVMESGGVNSNGSDIYVMIPASSHYTVSAYNASLTTMSGLPVQNAQWNYMGVSGSNHVFRFIGQNGSKVLAANASSAFGIFLNYSTNFSTGIENILVTVYDGAGGENNNHNNRDSEAVIYSFN